MTTCEIIVKLYVITFEFTVKYKRCNLTKPLLSSYLLILLLKRFIFILKNKFESSEQFGSWVHLHVKGEMGASPQYVTVAYLPPLVKI